MAAPSDESAGGERRGGCEHGGCEHDAGDGTGTHASLLAGLSAALIAQSPAPPSSPLEALESLERLQSRRDAGYREWLGAMTRLEEQTQLAADRESAESNLAAYCACTDSITGEFAVVSNAVRNLEALLRGPLGRGDLADLVRALQLIERDRLVATSAQHALRGRRLDVRLGSCGASASLLSDVAASAGSAAATIEAQLDDVASVLAGVHTRLADALLDLHAERCELRGLA